MKIEHLENKTIAISRTDSIGDVILTLPTCAWIKSEYPSAKIVFFGKSYTKAVLECYPFIDQIICWDEWEKESEDKQLINMKELGIDVFVHVFPNKNLAKLAKKAKIATRVGTSHRLHHWWTCNVRPSFTRKDSNYHEAQLNFELLRKFGVKSLPEHGELVDYLSHFKAKSPLTPYLEEVLATDRNTLILHTKSQGSAVEWPLEKYIELANLLVKDSYRVYFSGTEKEGLQFREFLPKDENIIDVSGKSSLAELITFISRCDGLVACSTGPLHIAAILGVRAIGLYTDLRPMHPGRWAPIGKNSYFLTIKNTENPSLDDINRIRVEEVMESILT